LVLAVFFEEVDTGGEPLSDPVDIEGSDLAARNVVEVKALKLVAGQGGERGKGIGGYCNSLPT
jgi:hypothetical protein